jgi:hypothetical protein
VTSDAWPVGGQGKVEAAPRCLLGEASKKLPCEMRDGRSLLGSRLGITRYLMAVSISWKV